MIYIKNLLFLILLCIVLRKINTGKELLKEIRRHIEFLGHFMREEALGNLSLREKIEISRGKDRPQMKPMVGMKEEI